MNIHFHQFGSKNSRKNTGHVEMSNTTKNELYHENMKSDPVITEMYTLSLQTVTRLKITNIAKASLCVTVYLSLQI